MMSKTFCEILWCCWESNVGVVTHASDVMGGRVCLLCRGLCFLTSHSQLKLSVCLTALLYTIPPDGRRATESSGRVSTGRNSSNRHPVNHGGRWCDALGESHIDLHAAMIRHSRWCLACHELLRVELLY